MANMALLKPKLLYNVFFQCQERMIQTSSVCAKAQSGRYKTTVKKNKPLTYEMANKPHHIGVTKAWNSWNTSTLNDGLRKSETALEDMFVRKFIYSTFPGCILSEIIIKRQFNMIRVGAIYWAKVSEEKTMFLIGYSQELLSYWLQSPVKLEFQVTFDPDSVIFKYV